MAAVETTALYGVKLKKEHRNAYATMMYMGTPRDYEFYVATRVLIKSLVKLQVDADLVVIASLDVPLRWDSESVTLLAQLRVKLAEKVRLCRVNYREEEDGAKVKTDELFQCGQFCAVFINPCIFHTGLFVLQPSQEVFKDMIHSLETGKENPDGADQGFIGAYFPDLLDQPMFHPPLWLQPRWTIQTSSGIPNGCILLLVITFPGALWLKPWYWWSWPVLPLGIEWHETSRQTLGYAAEMPIVIIQSIIFLGIIVMTHVVRPTISKLYYKNSDKTTPLIQSAIKLIAIWSILPAYVVPFAIIPRTIHPLVGWGLYFLGSIALSSVAINSFMLHAIHVFVPLIGIFGSLLVMAYPWYNNGVVRALVVFGYAFCYAPVAWASVVKVLARLHVSAEREQFFPKLTESPPPSGVNKLC
ncbi:putative glucuronosyltransferase PGSIP7 [Hibiscus syriacus]|uniref:Glucuronosyltransferase PGSIP7 n=1 Tax=Hibiscus syriacus TaxID=106335 RepID=A0A6A3BBG2_HIBSY|nr:putative glucuronosyltransferase PGSIP7 [Hibiscus syriacus]